MLTLKERRKIKKERQTNKQQYTKQNIRLKTGQYNSIGYNANIFRKNKFLQRTN